MRSGRTLARARRRIAAAVCVSFYALRAQDEPAPIDSVTAPLPESDERDADERDGLPAMQDTLNTNPRPDAGAAGFGTTPQAESSLDVRRVALAWTDPEEGGTLWIELWGSPAFVAELVDQGFVLQADELADEVLDLRYLSEPAPRTGAHLRARIHESGAREH